MCVWYNVQDTRARAVIRSVTRKGGIFCYTAQISIFLREVLKFLRSIRVREREKRRDRFTFSHGATDQAVDIYYI